MSGCYVHRAHQCHPPADGKTQDVWRCDCGQKWECSVSAGVADARAATWCNGLVTVWAAESAAGDRTSLDLALRIIGVAA